MPVPHSRGTLWDMQPRPRLTRWHIAYDIADPRRLRRVERALAAVGERVHNSLFVCELSAAELSTLQTRLDGRIDAGADVLRYTPLCRRDEARLRHLGCSASPDRADAWIV